MSTKQTIIFTLMILFLGVMLYALGAWFYWDTQLGAKQQAVDALKDRIANLTLELKGRGTDELKWGVEQKISDPERGLERLLDRATRQADNMQGNDAGGAKQRENLYDERGKELEGKWPVAKDKWKALYASWAEENTKIKNEQARLRTAIRLKDEKIAGAQSELDAAQNDENVERLRTTAERKKQNDELGKIRVDQEDVQEKITRVARESERMGKISGQAKIIFAALDLKKVVIDRGSDAGFRKGLTFDVYGKTKNALIKKGRIEITAVRPASADGMILPPKQNLLQDPQTGWVAPDPGMRYSVYSATGADESDAQPLERPKSRTDRINTYLQDKAEKELGAEEVDRLRREKEAPDSPPVVLGQESMAIAAGDWINNPEFVPILSDAEYAQQCVKELRDLKDVNVGPLVFYFTDSVKTYRQEFLKRLCERNLCRVAPSMSADVNYVVTSAGSTRADLVSKKIPAKDKDKGDEASPEVKSLLKTLAALQDAQKYAAGVVAEDELESFFGRRQRKLDLLHGSTLQPGQHSFFIAGETQDRSASQLKKFITENHGVIANDLDASVDYVVVGSGLSKEFLDNIRKKGLRIIREDELPAFFGLK